MLLWGWSFKQNWILGTCQESSDKRAMLMLKGLCWDEKSQYQRSLLWINNADQSHPYLWPCHLLDKRCSDQRWKLKSYFQPSNRISSLQVHFLVEVSTSSVQLVMARGRETSTTVTSQKPAGLPTVADQTRLISDGCHLFAGCQYGPDPGFVGAQWLGWKHLDQRNLRARSVASLTWPELT